MTKMSQKKALMTDKEKLLESVINKCMIISGYTHDELAIMLGMKPSTLYYRKKNVETFRLGELLELCRLGKLDDATRLQLLSCV